MSEFKHTPQNSNVNCEHEVGIFALQQRISELERDLLFANDAIAKGDLARQGAGGMEMKIQELERENTELIEQLSCESMEVDQLQLQVVRLRESLVRYSSQYQRWNTAIADKALTETSPQSAKEVFVPTVGLLKRLCDDYIEMPDILKLIKSEIDRLERLCND